MNFTMSDTEWTKLDFNTPGDSFTPVDHELLTQLRQTILRMHESTPISKVTLTAHGPVPFNVEILLRDGRKWKQTISNRTIDPGMTYDIKDVWKLSELTPGIAVLASITAGLVTLNLTSIDARPR